MKLEVVPDDWEPDEALPPVPDVDTPEELLDEVDMVYPDWKVEDTVVISGPLLHGVARGDADEAKRMTRVVARKWALKKYGRIIEMVWHPHRWAVRVHRKDLPNGE